MRCFVDTNPAQAAACDVILTEDLSPRQQLGDLRVENPFRTSPADFADAGT